MWYIQCDRCRIVAGHEDEGVADALARLHLATCTLFWSGDVEVTVYSEEEWRNRG